MSYAGLRVVEATSRHFFITTGLDDDVGTSRKGVLDLLGRIRPTLGAAIVIVAEKP